MNIVSQSPALYQPTDAEITGILAASRRSWPTLESRIDKAEQILLSGGLQLEPVAWEVRNIVHWRIQSQAHAHGSYIVTGRTLGCNCPDRTQHLGDVKFCKHTIAVAAYLRIVRDHFNADVRARKIDLGMLHTGQLSAYAPALGICIAKNRQGSYHFVDSASAIKYSAWLAKQEMAAFESVFETTQLELVAA